MADLVPPDKLTPRIEVVLWASTKHPGIIADEWSEPFTDESFRKIAEWAEIPPEEVRARLADGRAIDAFMYRYVLSYPLSTIGSSVKPHTACRCPACTHVMAEDLLPEWYWDCNDHPRPSAWLDAHACSDPHRIGCRCVGAPEAGEACTACQIVADGAIDLAASVARKPKRGDDVLWIMFTEGDSHPDRVVDERAWPLTEASFRKIERITGLPAAQARELVDGGRIVTTRLMWFRRVAADLARDPGAVHAAPTRGVSIAGTVDGHVAVHQPCACVLCVLVATHGWLQEGHMDCGDHQDWGSMGACSDPHGIGCTCLGTTIDDGPCEACGLYPDPEQVKKIVAMREAGRAKKAKLGGDGSGSSSSADHAGQLRSLSMNERRVLDRYASARPGWPRPLDAPTAADAILPDLFRGTLVWGAVGDAMGRGVEGRTPAAIVERYGLTGPDDYERWHGWRRGPTGTITDDTQLTMVVAESLLVSGGAFAAADFCGRLVAWLPDGRGVGRATRRAIEALERGTPWEAAGERSAAGNGAAMRAAPIGLVHALDATPARLIDDAILFSVPTHAHPAGVAGSAILAAGVAWLVRERLRGASSLDVDGLIAFMAEVADAVAPETVQERRRPSLRTLPFADRVRQAGDTVTDAATVFDDFWSGAFVIESLPCAINAFVRSPDDPLRALRTAIRAGYDTDTIASMAGNLAGAWMGADALRAEPGPWWEELEYRDRLIELADGLHGLVPVPGDGPG